MRIHSVFWLFPLAALLAACAHQPPLPGTRVGKPYMQGLNIYFPSYDENYDKVGEASWYGPGFNGKSTASGEPFDQDALTAASPTLPMPSLVRVTNLSNGKNLIVRINDRGPFAHNRIIDLSKRAARELGIRSVGQVRVQFLKAETEDYIARSETAGHPVSMASYNNPSAPAAQVTARQPETPPAQTQIVESDTHETHASDTVSSIAPVMTVSSNTLKPATNLSDRSGHPVQSMGLVQQAWADDDVSQPDNDLPAAAEKTEKPPGLLIQAGAFSTQNNAKKLASKLKSIAAVIIDEASSAGKDWWRVRLGPFTDESEAAAALEKIHALGIADARIVH